MLQRNVLGDELIPCSMDPLTGYYRSGCCENRGDDPGFHVVCCQVTAEFLAFSSEHGNDLSTPMPQFAFPGLVAGNRWCLVAQRWLQAHQAGKAPRVYLRSTNQAVLGLIPLDVLKGYALDLN